MSRGVVWNVYDHPIAPPVRCAFGTCETMAPATMGFCLKHWLALPQDLRSGIWKAYTAAHERFGRPSAAFIEAYDAARVWVRWHLDGGQGGFEF